MFVVLKKEGGFMGLSALCRSSVVAIMRSWTCRSVLALAAAGAASSVASAGQLDTIFTGGNGLGTGANVYFDLTVNQPLRIDSFNVNLSSAAGTSCTLTIFVTAAGGTYVGNTANAGAWTQVATGTGTSAGNNLPTPVDTSDFVLPAGTYGVAVQYNGAGMNYTNGNGTTVPGSGTNQTYSTPELTLLAGCSQAAPFTGALNNPRVWNGSILYTNVGGLGACCAPNGTCSVVDLATCASPNVGQNPGSTCSGAGGTCPVTTSACCNNTTFACVYVSGTTCPGNATNLGAGSVCSPSACVGACCANNGSCTVGNLANCASPSIAQAFGSTCSGAGGTCPNAGIACCNFVGACVYTTSGSCPAGSTQTGTVCSPTPCATQPSICEGLENVSVGSLPAGWTSLVATGAGADWTVVNTGAHSGTNSVFTNDIATVSDQILTLPPVTAAGDLTLDLWSSFTTENTFDGWVVEVSTDGGGTWNDVGQAAWVLNGYNATISANFASPILGRPAFSGTFPAWTERACTIPATVGQQVTIRFRMASDSSVASTGVSLDDICIYNIQVGSGACCASDGACAVTSNTTCTGLFRGVGTACVGNACPGEFGKCCNNSTGACVLVGGAAACGATSTYGGNNTTCATACVSSATCCNPSTAACIAIFGGSCPAGLDLGGGTACGPNSCEYGACCGGCAGCNIRPAASCSGTYAGNGTACATACVNDGYSVAVSPTTVTYIPATNDIGLYQDDATQAITLPFDVSFYGTTYSSVTASTNGNLQFTTAVAAFGNICLPANTILGPAIFTFWDDMYTASQADGLGIFTETTGAAPNRTFVIEWRAVYCCAAGVPINDLEILFYEGQNFFDVVYATPMGDRSSATIGVQSNGTAGSPFTQFICNTAGPVSGDAIRFACGSAATNGACCNNTTGACSSTTQATCPSGSTFQGAATLCNPNPCPQPPSGVCCRGATCSTTVASSAACTSSLIGGQTAGASFPTGASCNTTGVTNTPCCYADYNKVGGITVNDIFDFLNDWFAGSPYANTGGNGAAGPLAVQNIFDFLNAWFAGGC